MLFGEKLISVAFRMKPCPLLFSPGSTVPAQPKTGLDAHLLHAPGSDKNKGPCAALFSTYPLFSGVLVCLALLCLSRAQVVVKHTPANGCSKMT